jgi:hypothetical protein
VIELPAGIVLAELAAEGEAQVRDVLAGRCLDEAGDVDAQQRGRPEMPGGFFQRLARAPLRRRFARIEVAGRIVQAQAMRGFFFHQQEAAILFDDGGHGDTGSPTIVHWRIMVACARMRASRSSS